MEQMKNRQAALAALRARLDRMEGGRRDVAPRTGASASAFPLPASGALHEVHAAGADGVAANAFALGLTAGLAGSRPVVWALQDMAATEGGVPYGPGLTEMGLAPDRVLLVRARDAAALLAVGEEALRSPAVGAVVLSAWGEARAFTLTAGRRLALAAQGGGGTILLVRVSAALAPSAAETRWRVRAAPSVPLEANAPGRPAFHAELLRRRRGGPPGTWIMEWDRERRSFVDPATPSGGLVSLPAHRQAGARGEGGGLRRVA